MHIYDLNVGMIYRWSNAETTLGHCVFRPLSTHWYRADAKVSLDCSERKGEGTALALKDDRRASHDNS